MSGLISRIPIARHPSPVTRIYCSLYTPSPDIHPPFLFYPSFSPTHHPPFPLPPRYLISQAMGSGQELLWSYLLRDVSNVSYLIIEGVMTMSG